MDALAPLLHFTIFFKVCLNDWGYFMNFESSGFKARDSLEREHCRSGVKIKLTL